MLGWDKYQFDKKRERTCYAELLLLHPMGSTGHIVLVVHSGASGHETSMHYFSCSSGTGTDLTKSAPRHVTPNLWSCMRYVRGAKH
jgi:hypothetical protein